MLHQVPQKWLGLLHQCQGCMAGESLLVCEYYNISLQALASKVIKGDVQPVIHSRICAVLFADSGAAKLAWTHLCHCSHCIPEYIHIKPGRSQNCVCSTVPDSLHVSSPCVSNVDTWREAHTRLSLVDGSVFLPNQWLPASELHSEHVQQNPSVHMHACSSAAAHGLLAHNWCSSASRQAFRADNFSFYCWQGWFLVTRVPAQQRWQLHHYIGLGLWVFGWLTNIHADHVLRSLRTGKGQGGLVDSRHPEYSIQPSPHAGSIRRCNVCFGRLIC